MLSATGNPYPGLRAFRPGESAVFFGRDEQIDDLVESLAERKLLAVVGESGCGKSSLVKAGLIPALETGCLVGNAAPWKVAEMRPGREPMRRLAAAVLGAFGSGRPSADEVSLFVTGLKRGPRSLVECFREHAPNQQGQLLILVDQFEELIRFRSGAGTDEADAFVALLLATAESELPIRIVLTLRTDYLGKCSVFRRLPEALTKSQYLTPLLTREQLYEAIVLPARLFRGDVDEALANQIINEVGKNQDQLPVVQHALMWMWTLAPLKAPAEADDQREAANSMGRTLNLNTFLALKGLGDALSNHASNVYDSLSTDKQLIAQRMFCALWEDDARIVDNRRPCAVSEAAAIAGVKEAELIEVANSFRAADHCFVMPPASEGGLDSTSVLDVSHESLFRHWDKLKSWTAQEAKDAEEFRDWRHRAVGRKRGRLGLLAEADLRAARDWRERVNPNPAWAARYQRDEGDYDAIQALIRESEVEERRQRRRRLTWRAAFIALLLSLFGSALLVGINRERQARAENARQEEQLRASRDRFAAAASNALLKEPGRALQLVLQVAHAELQQPGDNEELDSRANILRGALRRSRFRGMIVPSLGSFHDSKLLPGNGQVVTVGGADGLAIWALPDGKRLAALFGNDLPPKHLVISRGGDHAFTGGDTGTIDSWDLRSRRLVATLDGHADSLNDLALSPDGSTLASASDDGSARLWRVLDSTLLHTLWGHLGKVNTVAFSHDGERLATAGDDFRIIIWDVASGKKVRSIPTGDENVAHLVFDAAGSFLAGAAADVRLWDAASWGFIGSVRHTNRSSGVAFSPDRYLMGSIGLDGALRVWDAESREQLLEIFDEAAFGDPGAFRATPHPSPQSRALAASNSAASSSTGALERQRRPVSAADSLSRMGPTRIDFSSDSNLAITTGFDGTAKVWSVFDQEELVATRGHRGEVSAITFSRDGRHVASVGVDGTTTLWEWKVPNSDPYAAALHELARTPPLSGAEVLAFSPDGRVLATNERQATGEAYVVFWKVDNERLTRDSSFAIGADRVKSVAFYGAQDAPRLLAAVGQQVVVWDFSTRQELFRVSAGQKLFSVAVSPDEKRFATECTNKGPGDESNRLICIWDAETGQRVSIISDGVDSEKEPMDVHYLAILAMTFLPDGKSLVSASKDKVAKIWDVGTGELLGRLFGHSETLQGVAVSPDGRIIATAATDSVRLWDSQRHAPLLGFPNAEPGGVAVTFSPDGQYVIVGGKDGILRTYPIDAGALVALARDRVFLPLSSEDCERYAASACLLEATPNQSANAGRLAMRASQFTDDAVADWLEPSERVRYRGARLFKAAIDSTVSTMASTFVAARRATDPAETNKDAIITDLRLAVAKTTEANSALFVEASKVDSQLPADAPEVVSRIVAEWLQMVARDLARDGTSDAVSAVLSAVPGRSSAWASTVARDVRLGGVFRGASEAVEDGHYERAIDLVNAVDLAEDDPRRGIWLRLASRALAFSKGDDERKLAGALSEQLAMTTEDADIVLEQALAMLGLTAGATFEQMFIEASVRKETSRLERLLMRARRLDPRNEKVAYLLGQWHVMHDRPREGVELLSRSSPRSEHYKQAMATAGGTAFDVIGQLEQGYLWMIVAADGRDAGNWANLAEASLAMGRLLEARLFAQRVLDARVVDAAAPGVQLAMRMVIISSLLQSGDMPKTRAELRALVEFVKSGIVEPDGWSYAGSRAAVSRSLRGEKARFLLALIGYCDSVGTKGSPEELESLLDRIAARKP
jgi:WD40 repeat protein